MRAQVGGLLRDCTINRSLHYFLAALYTTAASMFLLDKLCQRLLVPRPREQISLARDALHLLAAPLVILAYSCVEFWSIMEVTGHNTYTMNNQNREPAAKTCS